MIRARLHVTVEGTTDHVPLMLIGLSDENLTRLRAGDSIRLSTADVGMPGEPSRIAIIAGSDNTAMTSYVNGVGSEYYTRIVELVDGEDRELLLEALALLDRCAWAAADDVNAAALDLRARAGLTTGENPT